MAYTSTLAKWSDLQEYTPACTCLYIKNNLLSCTTRYSPFHPSPVVPPKPTVGSKLPPPSGRWDNTTNTPSYHRSNQEFWATRKLPIPVRSTVSSALSGLGFTPDSAHSEGTEEIEVFGTEEEGSNTTEMPDPSDSDSAAEAKRLTDIRKKVEFKISRLKPDRITASQVSSSRNKLDDILDLSEEYGIGMTALLENYPSMEESFKLQYKADLDKLLESVDNLEERVCDKLHLLLHPQPTGREPGTVSQHAPAASDLVVGESSLGQGFSRADPAVASLLP